MLLAPRCRRSTRGSIVTTQKFAPIVRSLSLVDEVTARLEAAIISGELEPGSRISEQQVAATLGVSRGPLREAIRRLEGRKLLIRQPNVGVKVIQLSLDALVEILFIREALEGMAAALAAQHMSDDEIEELRRLLSEHALQEGVKRGEAYYQESKDIDFHFRIAKASRNERLFEMLSGELYDLMRMYRYRASTAPGRTQEALNEHRAIVEAIALRDPGRAEQAMRQHIRNARKAVERTQGARPKRN